MGRIDVREGQFAKAERLLNEAVEVEGGRNSKSLGVSISWNDLAFVQILLNKYLEAESSFASAIEITEQKPSAQSRRVFQMNNFASLLLEMERFKRHPRLRKAVSRIERISPQAAETVQLLTGRVHFIYGRLQEASTIFEDIQERWEQKGSEPETGGQLCG